MLTKKEVSEAIQEIFNEYSDEQQRFDVNLIDSFMFIQVILSLEDRFDIEFDDETLRIETLSDLNYLENYIHEKIMCLKSNNDCSSVGN